MTVFRFADRRGDEGDGNPLRVGGMYGRYGDRVAKVHATTPWPEALVEDLTTALGARGVETVAVKDQEYAPGSTTVSTPLVLAGEIRNFSTEFRFTLQARIADCEAGRDSWPSFLTKPEDAVSLGAPSYPPGTSP